VLTLFVDSQRLAARKCRLLDDRSKLGARPYKTGDVLVQQLNSYEKGKYDKYSSSVLRIGHEYGIEVVEDPKSIPRVPSLVDLSYT
jgi:hypothetical protein